MPIFVEIAPIKLPWFIMAIQNTHSTDPDDYQDLPQSIGAMSKHFADGFETPLHHHARDQLLHAAKGIMRLRTEQQAWIVPRDSAVYIPAGTLHAVSMHGEVEMRTLYMDTSYMDTPGGHAPPRAFCVVAVSNLLRELILALGEEPMDYDPHDPNGRGGLIARMIGLEISRARELTLNVPLPKDARLQRLCAALLADLSDRRSLDAWSDVAGASARTLARLFSQDLGMSFNRWRQRIRFHSALEALSRGEAIAGVAQRHGYRSASAFSAAFGKEMGLPPSKVADLR